MQDEKLARALDVCLAQIQAGNNLDQALELYPQWSQELTPPLEAAQALRIYGSALQVSAEIQEQSKKKLLLSAKNLRSRPSLSGLSSNWWYLLLSILLILFIFSGAAWLLNAAADALPGDTLYPIKLAGEQTRLAVATEPGQRLELERSMDQTRLNEIQALAALGRRQDVVFAGGLLRMQPGEWQVGGIPVQVANDARIVGQVQEGISVQVEGILQPDGHVKAEVVRPREFLIAGPLQMSTPNLWQVSGVPFQVNGDTILHTLPSEGKTVRVTLFLTLDGKWLARLVDDGQN